MAPALEDQDVEPGKQEARPTFRFEDSPRRVRAVFAGQTIADSTRMKLLSETKRLPVYYFPTEDVRMDLLVPSDHREESPYKGEATYWSVQVGDRRANDAAWAYQDPPEHLAEIEGYVAFYWDKMDAWFEEDDEVFVHARDPYHRVDVLNSSRHIRVVIGGETVAETRRPRLLFETNLPPRYYIPKADIRMDLLEPTDTSTSCPYKGTARYWSVNVGGRTYRDYAWSYAAPIPECPKIENLVAFFNERVDAIYVDGEKVPVPITPWSQPERLRPADRSR